MNRRDVLSVSMAGLSGLLGGCLSSTGTEAPMGSTQRPDSESHPGASTSTPEGGPRTTEACGGTSSDAGAGGGRPPWAVVGHPADIVVSHDSETAPTVTLQVRQKRRQVDLTPEGYHWLSGDVVPDETAATITVETENGLSKTLDWEPEQYNRQYATFVVADDRIRSRVHTKRCESDME